MNGWAFLIFPMVGAAIGWGTNWLAVKMIFRPRRPVQLLGLRFEGVIPRRRGDLARSVAETVERDLITVDMIQSMVKSLVEGDRVRNLLHQRVHELIQAQLKKLGPIMQAFIPGDLAPRLEGVIEQEIISFIEGMSGEIHDGIAQHLDIHEVVRTRIEGFDLEKLESIVFRIAKRELRHIEWLGAVLGAVIGLVQAGLVLLLGGNP